MTRSRKILIGIFLVVAIIVVAVGALYIFLPPMVHIEESLTINKSLDDVWTFVTDVKNIEKMSQNVIEVVPTAERRLVMGSQFQQIRLIHGNRNPQTVTIVAYEEKKKYITKTALFDVDVFYTYAYTPIDGGHTMLTLTKEAHAKGLEKILLLLLRHLFTAPEHDGGHIQILKHAVEEEVR